MTYAPGPTTSSSAALPFTTLLTTCIPTTLPSTRLSPSPFHSTFSPSAAATASTSSTSSAIPTTSKANSTDDVPNMPRSTKTAAIVMGVFLIPCLVITSSLIWLYVREKRRRRRQQVDPAQPTRKRSATSTLPSRHDLESSRRSIFAEIWKADTVDAKTPEPPTHVEIVEMPADAAKSVYEVDGTQVEREAERQVEAQVQKGPFRSWLDLRKSGISQDAARKAPDHLGDWV